MVAVEVRAEVSGRPDAPAVVLSNSLGSSLAMWDPQIVELERHFRVIRYDIRGHGASPVVDGPYSVDDLVDDLFALLDRLQVGRVHLVGLSLGGMTAMRAAVRNPDRVDRMVLLCTAAHLGPADGWISRAATVRAEGAAVVAGAAVRRWFTPGYLLADTRRREAWERMVAETTAEGYAACCEAIAAMDLRDEISAITAPTLVIGGANDPATPPPRQQEIADAIQHSRLLVVDDAAHLASAEQHAAVTPAIVQHLLAG